jgi:hypothetical protein
VLSTLLGATIATNGPFTNTFTTFSAAKTQLESDLAAAATAMEDQYQTVINTQEYKGAGCTIASECPASGTRSQMANKGANGFVKMDDNYVNNDTQSYEVPTVQYSSASNGLQPTVNTERVMKIACTVNALKSVWYDQRVASGTYSSYYGDQSTGMWPHVPAPLGCITGYDPRMRPWYSSAATGPKDLIIVLDKSGSMGQAGRMAAAKAAADAVVDTLNHADFATVVTFSTSASSYSTEMIRADATGRAELKDYINSIHQSGKTNYDAAMSKAFQIMEDSKAAGKTSGCAANTIMFMSDGEITEGKTGDGFLAHLKALNHADLKTRVFTYALGFKSDLMRKIACAHGGLFETLEDGADDILKEKMARYYEVYATGVHGSGPRWSEVYADAATGQDVLTAAYPVYDLLQTPKQFFGVVGVDILPGPSGLNAFADWAATLAAAHAATRTCPSMVLTAQDEESLRKRIGGQTCAEAKAGGEEDADIGVILGGVAGGAVAVGIAFFAFKKCAYKAPKAAQGVQLAPVLPQGTVVQGAPPPQYSA